MTRNQAIVLAGVAVGGVGLWWLIRSRKAVASSISTRPKVVSPKYQIAMWRQKHPGTILRAEFAPEQP